MSTRNNKHTSYRTIATLPFYGLLSLAGASAFASSVSPVTVGSGNDSFIIKVSEDAYQGDAKFTVSVDGVQQGGTQTAIAIHSKSQTQPFTFKGSWGSGGHSVVVKFLNDAYGGSSSTDRNLYVDQLKYNKVASSPASAALMSNGPVSFSVNGGSVTPAPAPAAAVESASGTTVPSAKQIVDKQGNIWTIASDQTIHENGVLSQYTANVTLLVYMNSTVYQQNSAGGWWAWVSGAWQNSSDPRPATAPAPAAPAESASGTMIPPASQIVDKQGNIWTVPADKTIQINGVTSQYTANVTLLIYMNGVIYQQNSAGGWWSYVSGAWQNSSDPRPSTVPSPTSSPTSTPPATSTGKFHVSNGHIIGPDGNRYIAKGINVADWAAVGPGGPGNIGEGTKSVDSNGNGIAGQDGMEILHMFPNINMVRLDIGSGTGIIDSSGYADSPDSVATFVKNLTNAKVVVVIEDHVTNNTIPSGNNYTAEMNWYRNMANYYKDNPYVWFGTMNEPWGAATATVLQQELDIYNTIRNTGNTSPILIEVSIPPDAWNTNWNNQGSYFQNMHDVIWDAHMYYLGGTTAKSQSEINAEAASDVYAVQTGTNVKSADGIMPIILGEYGSSINGSSPDVNGTKTVIAAQTTPSDGTIAWTWGAGTSDRLQKQGNLTSFGKEVNQYFNGNTPSSWSDDDGS